jgi:hypothetical protein
MRGEAVTESVAAAVLVNFGFDDPIADGLL